jgi:hypothetical protein
VLKLKNQNALIVPDDEFVTTLGVRIPKKPYFQAGELADYLQLVRGTREDRRELALRMFSVFCRYRLPEGERVQKLQMKVIADESERLQTVRIDLGVYEDVAKLPLEPDELMEVITGTNELIDAALTSLTKDKDGGSGKATGQPNSTSGVTKA